MKTKYSKPIADVLFLGNDVDVLTSSGNPTDKNIDDFFNSMNVGDQSAYV